MSPVTAVPPRAAQMASLLSDAAALAAETERDDLVGRLTTLAERVKDPTMRVVVVGQFKQGKSALVNALVDAPVCPVDDVVGTAVPTVVSHGETITATLYTELDGVTELQAKAIRPDRLRDHVTEAAKRSDGVRPVRVDVTLPSTVLAGGLVLVDTPGVGGTTSSHAASTLTMLPSADAVLMLSDASQEYTDPELSFLKQAMSLCPTVTCVLSKIDPHPHWRDIAEADRRHLTNAGLDVPLVPVSASLHQQATSMGDAELDVESGIPELVQRLQTDVVERVLDQTAEAVGHQVLSVVDHLSLSLESELQILRDPRQGAKVVKSLQEAQAAANALGQRSAKWQQTLTDGVADFNNDIDYDLRDRLRSVGREAEVLIEDCDPGESWDEIGAWLADSIAQAVGDNFVWAHQRSEHLAAVVADHFAVEGAVDLPQFRLSDTEGVLNPIAGLERIETGELSIPQKVLIGMRSSYGGILMFGVMTSLAGMALINPISIAAGVIIGSYAYKQEAEQRLDRRRSLAKVAVRRLIEEAIFQVSKEARDRLNVARRTLRDHFTDVAANMKRSLNEAIEAAKSGAGATDERSQRIQQLEEREARLRDLVARATALGAVDSRTEKVSS
ncbi:hypothetical protein HMPREF0063_10509 [Aeromicrobium marinum DSM 15272]|uniref:Dynamin N-terminal domain-containing protein n=1 Tax=Aeromicrobium marinum DSM 15272 TaxID=585531 RepID=E2S901_9ACTN|nr:dynamin family protein [Aeromicrobium marinum]EFQ84656.1 hypothetical protein HMPREF0063_10509 [Aeromicrobium marinum DSM 15272]